AGVGGAHASGAQIRFPGGEIGVFFAAGRKHVVHVDLVPQMDEEVVLLARGGNQSGMGKHVAPPGAIVASQLSKRPSPKPSPLRHEIATLRTSSSSAARAVRTDPIRLRFSKFRQRRKRTGSACRRADRLRPPWRSPIRLVAPWSGRRAAR